MTIRSAIMRLFIATVVVSCATAYGTEPRQASSNPSVIATVDGVAIFHHEIGVRPQEVQTFTAARELEKLDCRIGEIIEAKAIESLGIKVQEDEVRRAVDAKFNQAGVTKEEASRISATYRALLTALEKWHQDKAKSASIYQELLAGQMTEAQWHQWQECYAVPEKLVQFRALVPRTLEDMKENSLSSSKRDLLHDKLLTHITRGVRAEEDEVRALYAEKYRSTTEKPEFAEIRSQLEAEMLERKKQQVIAQWWQARMSEVNIEIKDERLKKDWDGRNRRSLSTTLEPPKAVHVLPEADTTP